MSDQELQEKKFSDSEKMSYGQEARAYSHANKVLSEGRAAELSSEFVRLEVQIAALLFTLMGFFLSAFTGDGVLNMFWTKMAAAFAVSSLLGSLSMGLLHLKREEKFWDERTSQRIMRFNYWLKAAERKISFEEACAYHEGSVLDRGNSISTPIWTWILQTILLAMGVATLFVLFLAYLFS